jgi:DNA topoisomerase-1
LEFAGYTAVYSNFVEDDSNAKEESKKIPVLHADEKLVSEKIDAEQKFTKPPVRYTEASLIHMMEEKGIGRPATYAPTITVLSSRQYTEKEGKYLKPTELGAKITKYLDEFFNQVINVEFTADMENTLDDIAEKEGDWQKVIEKFWNFFKNLLQKADKSSVTYKKEPVLTDIKCEKCGNFMVVRNGPYGEFLGCSNFPACKNIVQPERKEILDGTCPICKKPTSVRKTRKGTNYYSCSGYPDCKFMSWDKPTGEICGQCNEGHLMEKKNEIRCSKCDFKQPKQS